MAELARIPKECVVCGGRFAAKRATALYCSERCRKRSQRALRTPEKTLQPATLAIPPVKLAAAPPPTEGKGIYAVTKRELETAGRLDTPMGQATMLIAEILSSGVQDTGSSIAALIRQYDLSLTKALAGVEKSETPLERIRRERALKTG